MEAKKKWNKREMLGREKEKEYFIGSKRTEKMKRRIVKIDKKLINEIEKKNRILPFTPPTSLIIKNYCHLSFLLRKRRNFRNKQTKR